MNMIKPQGAHYWVHGAYQRNKRLYGVWRTMWHRCNNPKRVKYKDYGGRGVSICSAWNDPNCFMDWAEQNGYKAGLQLDRIDNDVNYSPDNCRWATPKENSRNRRNTVILTVNGMKKSVAEWCEVLPVSAYTVYWWVKKKGKEYAEQRLSNIA